jgi:Polyketide cyclase / dehydrase and lipid transport
MAEYAFVTRWSFQAPIEPVWDLISKAERWPDWWPGVEKVELLEKGIDGGEVGSLRRLTWKSRLPYKLRFEMRTTRVERPRVLEGRAVGELTCNGRWELRQEEDWTHVRYDWRVATSKPWMNLLAPVARPLFAWNHDVVMHWGGEGLALELGCAWRNGEDVTS